MTDTFDKFGYTWYTGEGWGPFHPKKAWVWYDPSAVTITPEGYVSLAVQPNRRVFALRKDDPCYLVVKGGVAVKEDLPLTGNLEADHYVVLLENHIYRWNWDNTWIDFGELVSVVEVPYGVGMMRSERNFPFGYFQADLKLPTGVGMWPAYWFDSTAEWPPEIDFEGYSQKTNYVKKKTFFYRKEEYLIQTCLHYREEWKIRGGGVENSKMKYFNGNPSETFNKYGLWWTDKVLEFYINDNMIRKITDAKALKYLSAYNFQVLINNHIAGEYKNSCTIGNPLIVRDFHYVIR